MTKKTRSDWRASNLLSVTLAIGMTTVAYFELEYLMNSITTTPKLQRSEHSSNYRSPTNYNGGLLLLTR